MTTLRSVIAYLASMVRCAGIAYIVVQVAIWHSFYTADPWRLAGPGRGRGLGGSGSGLPAQTLALALSRLRGFRRLRGARARRAGVRAARRPRRRAQLAGHRHVGPAHRPRVVRARRAVRVPLALASPVAYWAGAMRQPGTDIRTLTGAAVLLVIVGIVHAYGRRVLYRRAAAADAALAEADQAASEQYAILSGTSSAASTSACCTTRSSTRSPRWPGPDGDDAAEVVSQVPAGRGPDRGRARRPR